VSAAVFAFAEDAPPAARLAAALGRRFIEVGLHRFPDGEGMPLVEDVPGTGILYRSLDDPDPKLMPMLLAADALRRAGATRLVLVAPYMPYLRQDTVFRLGEPLSRDVLGRLVGPAFDRIVTVSPHLHRTSDLTPVFAGTPVSVLSAAELLAHEIGAAGEPLIVGPDVESEPWVAEVAHALKASHLVFEKHRSGDRTIHLRLPVDIDVAGRRVALVDDICSSGATLASALRALADRGAARMEVAVVHALFDARTEARLMRAGARRVASTDSCEHPTNAIHLAGLLAGALQEELRAP
jgi:ribose-phosphate pyrophosphokinase